MNKVKKIIAYTFLSIFLFVAIVFVYIKYNQEIILNTLTKELSEELNAKVTAQNLEMTFFHDFPKFSLTLTDVEILGDKYSIYKTPLFKAKRIYLQSDLIELFKGKISVNSFKLDEVAIIVFKTRNGYTNNCLKGLLEKQKSKSENKNAKTKLAFHNIELSNVSIEITDSIKGSIFSIKFIDFKTNLKREENIEHILAKGKVYFKSLTFNDDVGGFLNNQTTDINLGLNYNIENKTFTLEPASTLYIDGNIFQLSGNIEVEKKMDLTIKNLAVTHKLAMSILNRKICKALSKYPFRGSVNVKVNIKHRLDTIGLQPNVFVQGSGKNIDVFMKGVEFKNVSFDATFENNFDKKLRSNDANSRLTFTNVNATLEELPVKGKFFVHDMKHPFIDADITSDFDVKDAQGLVNPKTLLLEDGTAEIKLKYQGLANDLVNDSTFELTAKVDGSVKITNAEVSYLKTNYTFEKISLIATFDNSDIVLNSLNLLVNKNIINANGFVRKLVPFILNPKQKILGKINVSSPSINLTPFIAKNSIGKKIKSPAQNKIAQTKLNKVANVIDRMIQLVEIDVQLNANKVIYKNFKATNAKGLFAIHNDGLSVNKFNFDCSGGHFLTDANLNKQDKLTSIVKIENADASLLFKSFDNFNQAGITSDNIEGKLNALVSYTCFVDKNMHIKPNSMNGEIDATFKRGKLSDVFTLGNVGKLLLNESNLNNVEFEEIQSHGILKGYDMQIDQINVVSSYLSFTIQGVYSFKNNTDLSIAIPLANLKKRKRNEIKVSAEELKSNNGSNIYLRAKTGKDGKLSVKYDPLKKFR